MPSLAVLQARFDYGSLELSHIRGQHPGLLDRWLLGVHVLGPVLHRAWGHRGCHGDPMLSVSHRTYVPWMMTPSRGGWWLLGDEFSRRGCCGFIPGRHGVAQLSQARQTSFLGTGFPDELLFSWSGWIFCCFLISGVN